MPNSIQEATPPLPPVPAPATQDQPPGFFNQAQLNDIKQGEDLQAIAAAPRHAANLEKRGYTPAHNAALDTLVAEARRQTSVTGQARSNKKASTLNAKGPLRLVITDLQEIQSAARQKKRLLEAEGDPASRFDITAYLAVKRLHPNRTALLQNADSLIALAETDKLPGLDAAEILLIRGRLEAYRAATADQSDTKELAGSERLTRDAILKRINALRAALQHAADRAYPYSDETTGPARAAFHLPQDRVFVG